MAAPPAHVSPDAISGKDFNALLGRYPALIESMSAAKAAKSGQKTLKELDQYRYVEAPGCFRVDKPARPMEHDDVKTLVEWKLRHGKFRPTLMKLVTSNEPKVVRTTIRQALEAYQAKSDAPAALDILTKLRGIGPATASLLLSVHDRDGVIFFSDEAFYWLCCGGKKNPIKYNKKEYAELRSQAQKLGKRLGVSATDVEKVAYVIFKEQDVAAASPVSKEPSKAGKAGDASLKKGTGTAAKRKKSSDQDDEEKEVEAAAPVRRSKRGCLGRPPKRFGQI